MPYCLTASIHISDVCSLTYCRASPFCLTASIHISDVCSLTYSKASPYCLTASIHSSEFAIKKSSNLCISSINSLSVLYFFLLTSLISINLASLCNITFAIKISGLFLYKPNHLKILSLSLK